jgi:CheY-like chemotaxis protein/HPt (histidine-containing phosphotransfer) domain-containing protein
MWVESVPQKGSTFHFLIPFSSSPQATRSPLKGAQPQLADLHLLIVDDNPTNRRILTLQTAKWGMIPRGAQSGEQALEWLRHGETFDLAILDMQMPGMDGLMLAREIRALPGAMMMPLILLTSTGVRLDTPAIASAAFASCLTKPIKPVQLHETLVRVISGAKPAARKTTAPARLDATLAKRFPLRVLVCDDNLINRKVALRLLQQMGYQGDSANNGQEAIEALEKSAYDVIFMDIHMPVLDGMAATQIIRQRQQESSPLPKFKSPIIIIAMTANAMQGDREKCLEGGMDDYLAKPVRPEDIRAVIERWGGIAGTSEPLVPTDAAPVAVTPSTAPAPAAPFPPGPDTDPPVDMERLLDFANGNPENLRELINLYVEQTTGQIDKLESAARAGDAPELQRVAHSCAGASATCGMATLVPLLKNLERMGHERNLADALPLCEQARRQFERIRNFLNDYQEHHQTSIPSA